MPGYSNQTSGRYRLPYMKQSLPPSEVGEARAAVIADNSLDGIRRALPNGGFTVFEEGSYVGTFVSGASYVTLSGGTWSLDALVGGVRVRSAAAKTWTGLTDDNDVYYLYAQLVETDLYTTAQLSSRQDLAWTAIVDTTGYAPAGSLLLAVATTTGAAITVEATALAADLDLFIRGKRYWQTNPSGSGQVTLGQVTKVVTVTGLSTNARIFVTKTTAGPGIDWVEKAAGQFTVYLTGPAAPAAVGFDYFVERL